MKGGFLYCAAMGLLAVTALLVVYYVRMHHEHMVGSTDQHASSNSNSNSNTNIIHSNSNNPSFRPLPAGHPVVVQSDLNIDALVELVRIQNQTIQALEKLLAGQSHSNSNSNSNSNSDKPCDHVGSALALANSKPVSCPSCPACSSSSKDSSRGSASHTSSRVDSVSHSIQRSIDHATEFEETCESQYGMELVSAWAADKQIWCSGDVEIDGQPVHVELICYPHLQRHKKQDGRGQDMFCEARNVVIDFSRISGQHGAHKPHKGDEYLSFSAGSLLAACQKSNSYSDHLFMNHHALQMRSFVTDVSPSEMQGLQRESRPTYLLARDEDCENPFHSTADFMNMFLVYNILGLDFKGTNVMLFDKYPDGGFADLISTSFTDGQPSSLRRHHHYGGKRVIFDRLVFHLESPAGLIFPRVAIPNPLRCYSASLFQAYRRHILHSFDLLNVDPPPIPSVTLSVRRRTESKNVGRVLENEKEVYGVIKQGNLIDHRVIDGGRLSFREHLKIIRNTNVLVGVHGAGLMMIMFAAEEAVLVEIHPSYRQDRHFRHAARMTGKIYMPLRSRHRETCVGTSDNVMVPLDEFRVAIDGAVRLARVFDRGLVECGLSCPGEILAIDPRLDQYYKSHESKARKINTNFPC